MFDTVHRLENTDGSSQYLEKNNNIYNIISYILYIEVKQSLVCV